MDIVVLGIDLGKNSCSLAGLDTSGRVVLRRRMRRSSVESFVNGLGRSTVAMEACCGAHHLGRVFAAQALSASDVTGVCAPLCEGPKERRTGCGGDCRSGDSADDAVRCGEEPVSVGCPGAASGARTLGVGADSAN